MPFHDCIDAALAKNEINADYAKRAREIYDDHLTGFAASMPRGEAMAEAARSAFRYLEADAAETRRQAFLSLAARRDIMGRLDGYRDPRNAGASDPNKAATGLFDRLLPGRNGFAVEQQRVYWRNSAYAKMDEAFKAFRANWLLRPRNLPLMERTVRELFGETTGDDLARTIAKSWTDAAEFLRSNFNRFGGHIGLLEKWGLPQAHNGRQIRSAGLEEWRGFITPLLDASRMVDRNTGRSFAGSDASLADALDGVYKNILTEGWSDREATSVAGSARANTRADTRFLVFKDADSWLAYQKRFGEPNAFSGMLHHLDGLARDISLMQVLGPNPSSTMRWLGQELTRRRALAAGRDDRVTDTMRHVGVMYDMTTGKAFAPSNATVATIDADVSNVLTSAQLGSALISSVPSDVTFQLLTRRMNAMPMMRLFKTLLAQLASSGNRQAAIRIGAGAEAFSRALLEQHRYLGELHGHRATRFLADRVLAFSGLSPWTSAGRVSFFADALGTLADRAGEHWAALPQGLREGLARYRIGEPEWEAIRATPQYEAMGAKFIRAEDVANRTDLDPSHALELGQRISDWASSETEFAVPSHSLAGAARGRGQSAPGTLADVLKNSALMYRTFSFTMLMSHGRRLLAQGNLQKKGAYAASLVLTSMFAGAISLQMKELIAGRDLRDMADPRFWGAATAQGGGTALIGDFANTGIGGVSRTGGGLAEAVAGPRVGLVADVTRALLGAEMSPSEQDVPAATATNLLQFAKRYMPGGNLWYARLVLERYLFDAIQEDIDPRWKTRVRSIEDWYRRQYGNGFWWKRGTQPGFDNSEIRAPDLSNALGSKP